MKSRLAFRSSFRPSITPAFGRFWQARNDRERRILSLGALLLLLMLFWLLLIEPALEARARLRQDLPELRKQLAQMRAISAVIGNLSARETIASAASTEISRAAIERSLNDKGLKAQNLSISDDRLMVNFTDVSFATLAEWLQQSQSSSQLVVSDASVSARERLGHVDARLTLQRVE